MLHVEPRGIRNNNPLNIRRGQNWQGLRPSQTDPQFCQFVSMEYGCRAAIKLLRNYITGFGGKRKPCRNLHDIIHRWAPSSENDTDSYILRVGIDTGLHPFASIDPYDRKTIVSLVAAMAKVECGQPIDKNLIASAYDLLS